MKSRTPTVHPFLPSTENRLRAIHHVAACLIEPRKFSEKLVLDFHSVSLSRRRSDSAVRITYTPLHSRNMQSCEYVNAKGAPVVGSL